jgi:hypothetical protein
LAFVNLVGSNPNVKIPDRLKEKMSEEMPGFWHVD